MSKYHFFWGGPFSQWCPSKFTIEGVEYNCAEQYMMAQKAILFGDTGIHSKIMACKEPSTQKSLGKKVSGFDLTTWQQNAKLIVYRGNLAKFSQNPNLYEYLVATGDLEIVEASPEDKIWGIGLHESNPDVHDKSKWQGTNWLGEVIMAVRADLKVLKNG